MNPTCSQPVWGGRLQFAVLKPHVFVLVHACEGKRAVCCGMSAPGCARMRVAWSGAVLFVTFGMTCYVCVDIILRHRNESKYMSRPFTIFTWTTRTTRQDH